MARNKILPDENVFGIILEVMTESGEKGVSFGGISARCGLAPATLAQRFGTVEGMIRLALAAEWARLDIALTTAEADALVSPKGAQALLKALPAPTPILLAASYRDEVLLQAAENWRTAVEKALAARRGGGTRGREAAALLFAAWQGRQLWEAAGGKTFRLSDLMKSLT